MPCRRARREPRIAVGLPGSADPRPPLPAPPLLQVTHQDAHHIGPEPGERLRHAGARLRLRRGLGLWSRAGCSRVLHDRVPHTGRASRSLGPSPRTSGRPAPSAGSPPAASRSRAPAPHPPAAPATPRRLLARRPHLGCRWPRAARLDNFRNFPTPAPQDHRVAEGKVRTTEFYGGYLWQRRSN